MKRSCLCLKAGNILQKYRENCHPSVDCTFLPSFICFGCFSLFWGRVSLCSIYNIAGLELSTLLLQPPKCCDYRSNRYIVREVPCSPIPTWSFVWFSIGLTSVQWKIGLFLNYGHPKETFHNLPTECHLKIFKGKILITHLPLLALIIHWCCLLCIWSRGCWFDIWSPISRFLPY